MDLGTRGTPGPLPASAGRAPSGRHPVHRRPFTQSHGGQQRDGKRRHVRVHAICRGSLRLGSVAPGNRPRRVRRPVQPPLEGPAGGLALGHHAHLPVLARGRGPSGGRDPGSRSPRKGAGRRRGRRTAEASVISDSGRRPPGQDAVSHFRIAVALALSALGPAAGAVTGQAPGTPEQPWQVDAPVVEKTPVIDGILAPGEWDGAAGFELGYQIDPGDNSPPSERTEVFLMRTSEFLYVAFHAHDRDPAAVRARVARRDDLFEDDYVGLYLDTYNDRQRA